MTGQSSEPADTTTTRIDPDAGFPRDCWIDVETGEWGLASNLRLVRQTELQSAISADATPTLTPEARRALIRVAGIDKGQPISHDEMRRNI